MTWPTWLTPERRRLIRRSFKIALAAMLATLVAKVINLPNPWFATLAAIVAVEITLQTSLRNARNAILGAAIGAGAGLGMALIAKDSILAVGLVVLVAFVAAGWRKLEAIGRQAAIVASVIVLVPETADVSTEYFAWIRFAETVIGIASALLVNALIMPPHAYRDVRRNLAHAFEDLATMYRLVIASEATGHRDVAAIVTSRRAFRARMRKVDDLWDEAISERAGVDKLAPHWRGTTRRIWEQCTAMDDAVMDATARRQLADARDELRTLANLTADALDDVARTLNTFEPLPSCSELEDARVALLDRVRTLAEGTAMVPFDEALQAITFVNGMVVIAARLTEMAVITPEDERGEIDPELDPDEPEDLDAAIAAEQQEDDERPDEPPSFYRPPGR